MKVDLLAGALLVLTGAVWATIPSQTHDYLERFGLATTCAILIGAAFWIRLKRSDQAQEKREERLWDELQKLHGKEGHDPSPAIRDLVEEVTRLKQEVTELKTQCVPVDRES